MKKIKTPEVGALAFHKEGLLDPRLVSKVQGSQICLKIGTIPFAGPFPAENYTYMAYEDASDAQVTELLCPAHDYEGTHHLQPRKVPGTKDAYQQVCRYCKKTELQLQKELSND